MADVYFDLSFDGTLAPDADPLAARQQLGALFKLDEAGIARLFAGKPVCLRRAVDVATAAKFERVFIHAGAVLTIAPSAPPDDALAAAAAPGAVPAAPPAEQAPSAGASAPSVAFGLALAPQDGVLEHPAPVTTPPPDTSHLSLVSSPDWSLEDCEPAVKPAFVGNIGHLALVALDPTPLPTTGITRTDADL